MTDRRPYFFIVAALAVLAVGPLVPQFWWLVILVVALYLVFAAAFALADISTKRDSSG